MKAMTRASDITPPPPSDLTLAQDALQQRIGYKFNEPRLLANALTHPSAPNAANVAWRGHGYERLEFLGDRVLGLIVAELLLERFENEDEGALSKRLVALVRKEALLEVAGRIDLGPAIDLAAGSGRAYSRQRETAKADGVEALIGGIFQDGGFTAARTFVRQWWTPLLDAYQAPPKDPKTTLQEWAQGAGLPLPQYRVVTADGPDHQPVFEVAVTVEGLAPCQAHGRSKRAAEQAAATAMLDLIAAGRPG